MNRSYRYHFFGLLLLALVSVFISAEHHHATITTHFTQSNNGRPTAENRKLGSNNGCPIEEKRKLGSNDRPVKKYRSNDDFSGGSTRYQHNIFSTHQSYFNNYTADDFRDHFTVRGYAESEILNERCLYMSDEFVKYAQTHSGYKDAIRNLHAELKKINAIQKVYYAFKGTYCRRLQSRIQGLYKSLDAIKEEQQIKGYYNVPDTAEKTFYPIECFSAYQALESIYQSHTPSLANAINKRLVIYRNSLDGSSCLQKTNKSYNLNNNIKSLLSRSGYEISSFTQCYGNQLQQVIHQESLDILNHVGNLSPNSILYDHQEALVDLTASIVDYNHAEKPDKAMQIADLCWTLLDYGQAVMEGAALGLYSAAHDILTNPIEATVSIVAGKQVLAFQLCKVLYNVANIGVTAIHDTKSAQEKWDKYTEPLNTIIDAINKKEITVRDAIKGGTAFVVGYKAQGKLLGGLGKFCNTIKHKSINFVKNNPLFSPQEYLVTSEGLLFKATGQAKKDIGKIDSVKFAKIIEDKIAKINIEPLAVLRNGYYEVNGFKFTEYYYNRLWANGRKAPSLIAKSILENAVTITPDPKKIPGFFKYLADGWEMIYNPTTKIVSHLQPLKNFK